MTQVELYDTTLRDGTQYEGISLSVEDKLTITERLDQLGVHYIEGGWPGSNPKDAEFFERAKSLKLKKAVLTAFGSTRRANVEAANDPPDSDAAGGRNARCDSGGQKLGPARYPHPGDISGGEPGDDLGLGVVPQVPGAQGVLRR